MYIEGATAVYMRHSTGSQMFYISAVLELKKIAFKTYLTFLIILMVTKNPVNYS